LIRVIEEAHVIAQRRALSNPAELHPCSAFPADDGDLSRLVLGQGYEVREDREDFLWLKPEVAHIEER
jgi:hypothetical protein